MTSLRPPPMQKGSKGEIVKNIPDNLDKMHQFLKGHKLPKLPQEEKGNLVAS